MEERADLQRDILRELISYSDNLILAVQEVIEELRGEDRKDTDEFLNEIIDGINWEIEVYNQCAPLINEKSSYIDKKVMIQAVNNLGTALDSEDKLQIAECLEQDFLPFINKLVLASRLVF